MGATQLEPFEKPSFADATVLNILDGACELLPLDGVEEVVAGEARKLGMPRLREGELSPCIDDVFHERRDEDFPALRLVGHPGRIVHVETKQVAALVGDCLAGMPAHPDPDRWITLIGPPKRRNRTPTLKASVNRREYDVRQQLGEN